MPRASGRLHNYAGPLFRANAVLVVGVFVVYRPIDDFASVREFSLELSSLACMGILWALRLKLLYFGTLYCRVCVCVCVCRSQRYTHILRLGLLFKVGTRLAALLVTAVGKRYTGTLYFAPKQ